MAVDQLNTYDVLNSDDVVFSKGAYDALVSGQAATANTGGSAATTETTNEEAGQ